MKRISCITCILLLITSPILAAGFGANAVDIHGFVSQGYLQSSDYGFLSTDTEDGSYEFNEFGINFSSTVTDDLRIGMQLISRDLGKLGNNEVKIDWAYADYAFRNWLGLRVGRVKKAGGVFNKFRDIDATRTCILLPAGFYQEDIRDAAIAMNGGEIYGILPGGLEYQAAYGVFEVDKNGGVASVLETAVGGDVTDTDVEPSFNAWLNWTTPVPGLSFSLTATDFDFILDSDAVSAFPLSNFTGDPTHAFSTLETHTPMQIHTYGSQYWISAQYQVNKMMFAAEYLQGRHNTKTTVAGNTIIDRKKPEYWYVMATYRFCDWFEAGTYYCETVGDKDDRDGDNFAAQGQPDELAWLNDCAIFGRFDINPYWIFKVEAHFMDGLYNNVLYGNDPDPDDTWQLYAAKLTYVF